MNCDVKIKNRVHRCEGQMRGIIKMMDEHKDCKEIVTQLSAVRSSIDKIIALIAVNNLQQSYENEQASQEEIQKAVDLFLKSR